LSRCVAILRGTFTGSYPASCPVRPMAGIRCKPVMYRRPACSAVPEKPLAVAGLIMDLDGTLTKQGAIDFGRMRRRIGMPKGAGSILHWIERESGNDAERAQRFRIVEEEEGLGVGRMQLNDGFQSLAAVIAARGAGLQTAICTRNGQDALEAFHALLIKEGFSGGSHALFPVQLARNQFSETLGRATENKPSHEP
jgi:hypothetical protein